MKKNKIFLLLSIMVLGAIQVNAQTPTTQALPDTSQMTYNQISKGLGLFVFPTNGQSQQQQKTDEFECYKWAMEQTGIDPLNLPKVEVELQSGPSGGAVRGAARGAAAGAAIGAITGDAGEGAAVGATVGALRGRRAGKNAQAQQNQQAQANATAAEEETKNTFRKAFSACIKGKGYTVE